MRKLSSQNREGPATEAPGKSIWNFHLWARMDYGAAVPWKRGIR